MLNVRQVDEDLLEEFRDAEHANGRGGGRGRCGGTRGARHGGGSCVISDVTESEMKLESQILEYTWTCVCLLVRMGLSRMVCI